MDHPFNLGRNWKNRIHYTYNEQKECCDLYWFIKTHFPPKRKDCLTCVYVYTCDVIYVFINKHTNELEGPTIGYEFFTSVI